jgi:ADP-heptose:LPS heptosyltransferase
MEDTPAWVQSYCHTYVTTKREYSAEEVMAFFEQVHGRPAPCRPVKHQGNWKLPALANDVFYGDKALKFQVKTDE